jgi:hypothetical protein
VINHSLKLLYTYIFEFLKKVPPNVRSVDILGVKRVNLQQISRTANVHMYYNEDEEVSIIFTF